MTVLPTVRSQLYAAAERQAQHPEPERSRPRGLVVSARWRRTPVLVLVACLVLVAAAFGSGLIHIGRPAKPEKLFTNPRVELGALTPGTVRLLPISAADPAGGPPWGLRVLSTTRGVGCIQVGRLVDGKLGALGQDGAFADDGRFHELPVKSAFDSFSCAALDGKGRIFNNVTLGDQPASAVWFVRNGGCVPAGSNRYENSDHLETCPQSDERNLYYGLLGPAAKSITYLQEGHSHTVDTTGADGAYLLVTRAPRHQLFDFPGAGTADVVPVDGPFTAIHYRDGSTCHLTSRSWIGGANACTPSLQVPVGYAPVAKPPTAAQLATPLHTRIVRDGRGGREVLVSFTSRVAITSGRSQYSLSYHPPHEPPQIYGGMSTQSNIGRGQLVTMRIAAGGKGLRPGVYKGSISFLYATGPALLEGPGTVRVDVGNFQVRVR